MIARRLNQVNILTLLRLLPRFPWEICACYEKKQWFLRTPRTCVFSFWHICLTSPRKQWRGMTKFEVLWRASAHHPKRLLFVSQFLIRSCHLNVLTLFLLHSERLETTLWCQIMWTVVLEWRARCRCQGELAKTFPQDGRRIPFCPVIEKKREIKGILPLVCHLARFPLFFSGESIT